MAVVQADAAAGEPEANVEKAIRLATQAAARGASLVVFPEMFLTGYAVWRRLHRLALSADSPLLERLTRAAAVLNVWLLVGYPERYGDFLYNAVLLASPQGTLAPLYRKVHLFGREVAHFRPGAGYRLFAMSGLTIGCLVCYDLEFPEAARALAVAGADVIAVCTANMEPFRTAQDVYVRARALENQVFLALANRVGAEGGLRFVGGSGVWGPTGRALVVADRGEAILVATLDRRRIAAERRRLDYLADRRPDTYRRPVATATPGGGAQRHLGLATDNKLWFRPAQSIRKIGAESALSARNHEHLSRRPPGVR